MRHARRVGRAAVKDVLTADLVLRGRIIALPLEVGRKSWVVTKNVQDSQIDSNSSPSQPAGRVGHWPSIRGASRCEACVFPCLYRPTEFFLLAASEL